MSCGICGGQNGSEASFLRVLRFPLPIIIPPNASYSPIIRSWYNRPISGRRIKWTHPTQRNLKKNDLRNFQYFTEPKRSVRCSPLVPSSAKLINFTTLHSIHLRYILILPFHLLHLRIYPWIYLDEKSEGDSGGCEREASETDHDN
jgi:hypothetical protein